MGSIPGILNFMFYYKVNYLLHTLLWSKYRLLINVLIILTIYILLYSTNYAICMNNSNNIVDMPVSQSSHSQSEDLRREITTYVESHVSLLEEIERKNEHIQQIFQNNNRKTLQIIELRKQNGALGHKIHDLRDNVANLQDDANSFYDTYEAYKRQCKISGRLGNQVGELKQELREKNAEIAQLRSALRAFNDSVATRK